VLFVVDGPLKSYESELLEALAAMEKRIVVCLNKEDWYDAEQRDELVRQLGEQVTPAVTKADVVAVRSRPTNRRRVHVLSDGREQDEEVEVEPDVSPLARRMMAIVARDGRELLLANLLLQSRGLVDEAKSECSLRWMSGRMRSSASTCGRPAGPRRSIHFRCSIWPAEVRSR